MKKKTICILMVCACLSVINPAISLANTVLSYDFEGTEWWNDSLGNQANVAGGATVVLDSELNSNVLVLDGDGDFLEIVQGVANDYYEQYTIEVMIRPEAYNGEIIMDGQGGSTHHNNFRLAIDNEGKIFGGHETDNDDNYWVYSVSPIDLNQWCHVKLIYDGSQITLYINNNFQGSLSAPVPSSDSDNLFIGAIGESTPVNYFNGRIDNITIAPEPATILMFGLGITLLRRRNR